MMIYKLFFSLTDRLIKNPRVDRFVLKYITLFDTHLLIKNFNNNNVIVRAHYVS